VLKNKVQYKNLTNTISSCQKLFCTVTNAPFVQLEN